MKLIAKGKQYNSFYKVVFDLLQSSMFPLPKYVLNKFQITARIFILMFFDDKILSSLKRKLKVIYYIFFFLAIITDS